MPLFYLHRRVGNDRFLDPEGEHFPDLASATTNAKQAAREHLARHLLREEPLNGDAFDIWSEDGVLVAEVLFRDLLNLPR